YADALDQFKAGYAAFPLSGFLVNIAQCQRKLEKLDDAAASYQQFLDGDNDDSRLRAEVQEALAEVRAEIDRRGLAVAEDGRRARDLEEQRRAAADEAAARAEAARQAAARPDLSARPAARAA